MIYDKDISNYRSNSYSKLMKDRVLTKSIYEDYLTKKNHSKRVLSNLPHKRVYFMDQEEYIQPHYSMWLVMGVVPDRTTGHHQTIRGKTR